jgi:DNA-binding SARP family transcriptional activator
MREWEIELSPEPLCDEVGELVLHLAPLATMDPDKRRAILLSSSQRAEMLTRFERGAQLLRSLEQIDPRPEIEALRSALVPRQRPTEKRPARAKASAGR